jgi:hypothetical protein
MAAGITVVPRPDLTRPPIRTPASLLGGRPSLPFGAAPPTTRSMRGVARAFFEHVLPAAFVRTRHFGLHASRRRKDVARCRQLIGAPPMPAPQTETWVDAFRRLLGAGPLLCPKCGKADMVVVQILEPLSP